MKKKILIISITTIILISIISVVIYKQVQNKTKEVATLNNSISTKEIEEETKDDPIEKNEENTEDKNIELTNDKEVTETKEKITQVDTKQSTNEDKKGEAQKTNNQNATNNNTQQIQENKKEETKPEEPIKETKKLDLSKYDRYENALNGGYKAYMKSDSEMNKLRGLIDTCIKEFGYTNVKVVPNSSILGNTQCFTANKTNVENKVYNSEDFTIYYYAEAEYHITAEGTESIFQYRSYIKVQ